MKKLLKRILIASTVMVTALAAGIFTSCARGTLEDQKRKEGYIYTVTYDANGGTFGSTSTRTYALVKENSPTPAPGYVDGKTQASVKVPTRRDYELVGEAVDDNDDDKNEEAILSQSWFLAETDENGNIVYDSNGDPVTSATPWDFAKDKVTGDMTLVAKWTQVFRFSIQIWEDGTSKEIRTYTAKPGDTIADKLFNKVGDTIVRSPDQIKVKQTGYTILDFYMDETYQTLMDLDYAHPGLQDSGNTVIIYAKYLKGRFDFITNSNKKALTSSSNWYLLEDVDYAGTDAWDTFTEFKGIIYGNGYTIKNATTKATAARATAGGFKSHSIFGKMSGTVENLTLENVTMRVETNYGATVQGDQRVTFLASEFTENGVMNNVTMKNCSISLKILDGDGQPTLFTAFTGECGGLWWTAPTATQATNVVIKENDQDVTTIKIVQE